MFDGMAVAIQKPPPIFRYEQLEIEKSNDSYSEYREYSEEPASD